MTLRLSYKLVWPEARLVVNESADWGEKGEINISPDNIVVGFIIILGGNFSLGLFLSVQTTSVWTICLLVTFSFLFLETQGQYKARLNQYCVLVLPESYLIHESCSERRNLHYALFSTFGLQMSSSMTWSSSTSLKS